LYVSFRRVCTMHITLRRIHADSPEAAIACNLASGMNMVKAVKKANHYIEAGIKTSVSLGSGSGPINHFHSTYTLPFTP
jgi:hypothetical protein